MGIDKETLAWCAGFLDGEGSFVISSPRKDSPNLRWTTIVASQIDVLPLEKLKATFGGTIFNPYRKTTSGNIVHTWTLNGGKKVRATLPLIIPYLTTKKLQAELVLAYAITTSCGYRKQNPIPAEVFREREKIRLLWTNASRRNLGKQLLEKQNGGVLSSE